MDKNEANTFRKQKQTFCPFCIYTRTLFLTCQELPEFLEKF